MNIEHWRRNVFGIDCICMESLSLCIECTVSAFCSISFGLFCSLLWALLRFQRSQHLRRSCLCVARAIATVIVSSWQLLFNDTRLVCLNCACARPVTKERSTCRLCVYWFVWLLFVANRFAAYNCLLHTYWDAFAGTLSSRDVRLDAVGVFLCGCIQTCFTDSIVLGISSLQQRWGELFVSHWCVSLMEYSIGTSCQLLWQRSRDHLLSNVYARCSFIRFYDQCGMIACEFTLSCGVCAWNMRCSRCASNWSMMIAVSQSLTRCRSLRSSLALWSSSVLSPPCHFARCCSIDDVETCATCALLN